VNRAAFASAYSAFLARICDEVPARPRPGCRWNAGLSPHCPPAGL